ncbi:50S ribosomal protein L11 methyltransferase [Lutibacter sp.]|uniref:50S ribosomal protein L11 methyltransferase n=1 Tax=Lutibacter sp. TaxID=1925666 RepID=UPI0025BA2676|nr:50S ribosomal protein L11 methyltransferase [Lutibacter sp.]MCF6168758.1 50S ribosomal protein L11 methyltransferase [Lutibacter sp.]
MNIKYIGYTFKAMPKEPATEILIAQLSYVGFESFVENEDGVTAYIQEKDWNSEILENIQILNSDEFEITFKKEIIEQINWNSEWEKNFNQIQVANLVSIRAPFHENPIPKNNGIKYDIIIEPKMSFGTGHHETTHMMVRHLISLDLTNKKVLDMGCGTGVLAIFSEMKGARPIDAIDIDNWCYINSLENVERNNCKQITVYEGDASLLKHKKYDVIIANINRNILLNDMKVYINCLSDIGVLLLSGFYKKDVPIIDAEVSKYGLIFDEVIERNNWVALKYLK